MISDYFPRNCFLVIFRKVITKIIPIIQKITSMTAVSIFVSEVKDGFILASTILANSSVGSTRSRISQGW
jgi:hypothetical protein